MRIRRRLSPLLLGLALLFTQWLSFAHALEHPALAPDKACAVCILGINLDSGVPLSQAPAPSLLPATYFLASISAPVAQGRCPTTARARAPPRSLV